MIKQFLPAFLIVLLLAVSIPAQNNNDTSRQTDTATAIETVEFETVTTGQEEDKSFIQRAKEFLGDQHPAVIHFPLAWLVLLFLIEIVGLFRSRISWHKSGLYLLILTVVAFIPATATGLIQADVTTFNEKYTEILILHRNINYGVAALLLLTLGLRLRVLDTINDRAQHIIYFVLIGIATAAILYSGYLGGRLVHG